MYNESLEKKTFDKYKLDYIYAPTIFNVIDMNHATNLSVYRFSSKWISLFLLSNESHSAMSSTNYYRKRTIYLD